MSSLKYIAILGRQPELGLVEIESLVGPANLQPFGRQAVLVDRMLDVDRLGGVLKTGEVLYRGKATGLQELPIVAGQLPVAGSKTPFALSVYGLRVTGRELLAAGLSLKKQLRARGSVRLVTPGKGLAVSAAELRHNRVLEDGFELLVMMAGSEMVVARTLGVQDIDWYSRRDYDRPARSAKVGMLPPKLAQVLVNSVQAPVVYDPFCGTGVVLQEALLMGRSARGSDIAADMVEASRTNLEWLGVQVPVASLPSWQVAQADAREVELPQNCAIVSEGYLGTPLTHSPTPGELQTLRRELLELYVQCLGHWARQLPSGGEVSLCVPAWRIGKDWHSLGLVDELGRLGYTLRSFEHVRTPLLYARDDQIVGRQLLLLRKI